MHRPVHPLNIRSFPYPELVNAHPFKEMRAARNGKRNPGWKCEWKGILARWPSLVAHLMCVNGENTTPMTAATVLREYISGRESWSEWSAPNIGARHSTLIRLAIVCRQEHRVNAGSYIEALFDVMQEGMK